MRRLLTYPLRKLQDYLFLRRIARRCPRHRERITSFEIRLQWITNYIPF